MKSERVRSTVFRKLLLSSIAIFAVLIVSVYTVGTKVVEENLKKSYVEGKRAEYRELLLTTDLMLRNLNYLGLFQVMESYLKTDSSIARIELKGDTNTPIVSLKREEVSEDIEFNGKVKNLNLTLAFSEKPLLLAVESLKRKLMLLALSTGALTVILLYLFEKSISRRIERIAERIAGWREGRIEELEEDRINDELKLIKDAAVEMYDEIERERKISESLLIASLDILKEMHGCESYFSFIEKLREIMRRDANINYFKITDRPVRVRNGTIVRELKLNPNMRIVIEPNSDFLFEGRNLELLVNIVDASLRGMREKEEKRKLFLSTVKALANAVDEKSRWTKRHSERVAEISVAIGRQLGLGRKELDDLYLGGLLHDIGKIGIPVNVLDKPYPLSEKEFEAIKEHPLRGYRILKPVKELGSILEIVKYHHERCDGSGYPEGLKCKEIPVLARITAVADVVEAMLTERPYKGERTPSDVFNYLKEKSGTLFDEDVVNAALTVRETLMNIVKSRG